MSSFFSFHSRDPRVVCRRASKASLPLFPQTAYHDEHHVGVKDEVVALQQLQRDADGVDPVIRKVEVNVRPAAGWRPFLRSFVTFVLFVWVKS